MMHKESQLIITINMRRYELTNIFKRLAQEISQVNYNQFHMLCFDIKSLFINIPIKENAISSLTNCFRQLTVFSMDSPVHNFLLLQAIYFCMAMKRTGSITVLLLSNLYLILDMLINLFCLTTITNTAISTISQKGIFSHEVHIGA